MFGILIRILLNTHTNLVADGFYTALLFQQSTLSEKTFDHKQLLKVCYFFLQIFPIHRRKMIGLVIFQIEQKIKHRGERKKFREKHEKRGNQRFLK